MFFVILFFGSILYWRVGGWLILAFIDLMTELDECFLDIVRHVEVHLLFCVVPFHVNTHVSFALPVCCYFVMFFEYMFEMFCLFFANIFYPKLINNECELYWSGFVTP